MVIGVSLQNEAAGGSGPDPPTQAPPPQASPIVHGLPSLQRTVLLVWTQPVAGLHESSVQTLPSSQSCAAWGQSPCPTQESIVQASASMHGLGPGRQLPAEQKSGLVQPLPSLQAFVLSMTFPHNRFVQTSSVQAFPSLQSAPVAHCTSVAPMLSLNGLFGEKSNHAEGGLGVAR